MRDPGDAVKDAFGNGVTRIPDFLLPAIAVGHAAFQDKDTAEALAGPVAALGGIDNDLKRSHAEVFAVEFDDASGRNAAHVDLGNRLGFAHNRLRRGSAGGKKEGKEEKVSLHSKEHGAESMGSEGVCVS